MCLDRGTQVELFKTLLLACLKTLSSSSSDIGLYRENAIAIKIEASDSLTQTPSIDQSGLARKECNFHCDVHVMYTYCAV